MLTSAVRRPPRPLPPPPSPLHQIGTARRRLRPGDRVVLRHDDGFEELRRVSLGPKRIPCRDGKRWAIWLDGTFGWFALWRVTAIESGHG